ncbi:PREDICTED: UDP-glucuronosyltransferase 2B13-like [Bactrocera latifrons]|uniref:UDP-glucuronosyltransferase 2B13-like n=1 Tax=Bactrocera latifrons TaxID=174628 RepID=UPI0008DE5060|nr:PREDICTED: UDP-glucuronosyltransferase 2B13-like [Bactrocera latifrons]
MFFPFPFLLITLTLSPSAYGTYNILFMCPFPAPSHWMFMEHFLAPLLQRGHHVTTLTNHPAKQTHPNLTEILIEPPLNLAYYHPKENMFKMQFSSDFENLHLYWETGLTSSEYALNQSKVKFLIASKDLHFDLVILEQFFHESFLMFAHKFKCPVVTLGTLGYADNMDHAMGLLTPWSFVPHLFLSDINHMDFYQRAYNVYISLYDAFFRHWYYLPQMQAMAERHFGGVIEGPLPHVNELVQNISLMLINSHRSLDAPRPGMPGLVSVGGIHIKPVKPLAAELQRYLDSSTDGVIYFSLGTYIHSVDMPSGHIKILLDAFAQLKQNVLWKYENATIDAELPPNVRISKWLPQNDIFAHANTKLIITHGGIFSTQEGVYWGIPFLFIPIFGDQHRNARKAVHAGYARSLLFDKLTSDDLVQNIQLLLNAPQYKQKALEASSRFRDNPIHPLEEATYWMEYVMRHTGAPHLKSHSAYMPLYQYLLLDVLGCTLLLVLFIILLIIVIVNMLKRCLAVRLKPNEDRQKKQK